MVFYLSYHDLFFAIIARAEHFQFGPVLDQNKQPNCFFFSFWTELNRKPVQID